MWVGVMVKRVPAQGIDEIQKGMLVGPLDPCRAVKATRFCKPKAGLQRDRHCLLYVD
ncbi:hypothetical protein [Desertibacillus haloalkaliphilus]|uniref:hypothetical protein n=1 Tax=Desertibacillus haloalkaliphilus TaxID=1328930 RepID=UPI001C25A0E4|nr:hypothetical protein [Desertibacillus haloalkaliphilus]MBU8905274.1 hypothetical protein [Desertibacillus haloalkaliphilus]